MSCALIKFNPYLIKFLNTNLFLKELRIKLDDLLEEKISNPNLKIIAGDCRSGDHSHLLQAIIELITKEEVQVCNIAFSAERRCLNLSIHKSNFAFDSIIVAIA